MRLLLLLLLQLLLSCFSCVRLCVTHRWQPTRLHHPWDSPSKNTGVSCHFLLQCMKVKSESEVARSCLTHSNPMDCSLPGSSIHGTLQARVLEWGAIAFYSNQNSMVLAQTHTHRLIEQNRQPMNLSKLWEIVKDRGGCKSWT